MNATTSPGKPLPGYQPPTGTHLPLAPGEVMELPRRRSPIGRVILEGVVIAAAIAVGLVALAVLEG